ncbi:helix-turn-helix domain-containing protein [Paraburkholderia bannensis]|uniref:helix-turn-helix domain-containing protein n=1 Tax=Paraburkholderia bannensis TaxID=765414 RepID=UPI002AB17E69|nr:helix-turn-helix domain-containing protein [Paraburkholderia bannensis]
MTTETHSPRAHSTHATPAQAAPPARDGFGCSLERLALSQQLDAGELSLHHKHARERIFGQVETPAEDRGFLVGVSLQGGHRRRIMRNGAASSHDFGEHALYVRDFDDNYRADLSGSFDFVLVEVPRAWLERLGADASRHRVTGLSRVTGQRDDVFGHLARALLPAFEQPDAHSPLFLEQIGLTMGQHLVARYGGVSAGAAQRRATLSRWQETRAKELLLDGAGAHAGISVEAIAAECRLSSSYFIRAFRGSTGYTPYQWQLAQRIAQAQGMLAHSTLTLVEIANACGFSDQTHFTRMFSKAVGTSPGAWRRQNATMNATMIATTNGTAS